MQKGTDEERGYGGVFLCVILEVRNVLLRANVQPMTEMDALSTKAIL